MLVSTGRNIFISCCTSDFPFQSAPSTSALKASQQLIPNVFPKKHQRNVTSETSQIREDSFTGKVKADKARPLFSCAKMSITSSLKLHFSPTTKIKSSPALTNLFLDICNDCERKREIRTSKVKHFPVNQLQEQLNILQAQMGTLAEENEKSSHRLTQDI